jgi:hypothetical protein
MDFTPEDWLYPSGRYLFGDGQDWDLAEHGQLSKIRNHPEVRTEIAKVKGELKKTLKRRAQQMSCSDPNDTFNEFDSFPADVTDAVFFVGNTTIRSNAKCRAQIGGCRCCPGFDKQFPSDWGGSCQIHFNVSDWFKDPLDLEGSGFTTMRHPGNLGAPERVETFPHGWDPIFADPFSISGHWTESLSDDGKLPTPCS